jgi:DNA polymerase elongation subunit (family B)
LSNDWKVEAEQLARQGKSWRKIAEHLDQPKSTVSDHLRKVFKSEEVIVKKGPRVLIYDIETAPLLGYCWSLWDNNIGLNQIHSDWHVLSWAAKWMGEEDVYYEDQRNVKNVEDDKELLQGIWKLLDECDFVITQNGKKFDQKKLNARFVIHGMKPPSTYRHIDVLQIAKAQFGFTSNKLEYMTKTLCKKYKKSGHAKFSGFELWSECLRGNIEAWSEMEDYNILDILSLEELYSIISPWDGKLPNFAVYDDEPSDNGEWVKEGFVYSNLGKYDRYRNTLTGQQRRGSINLLSKEKRDSLLRNIV